MLINMLMRGGEGAEEGREGVEGEGNRRRGRKGRENEGGWWKRPCLRWFLRGWWGGRRTEGNPSVFTNIDPACW